MLRSEKKYVLNSVLSVYTALKAMGYMEEITVPLHRAVRTLKTLLHGADPDETAFREAYPSVKLLDEACEEDDNPATEADRERTAKILHDSLVDLHKWLWDHERKCVSDVDIADDLREAISEIEINYDKNLEWSVFMTDW